MARRLLVVVTSPVADDVLRDLVHMRAGDDAEMLVVAPASDISRLDWLTNSDGDARDDAAMIAVKTADATPTDDVKARIGDSDPVKAIEDALATFHADEILVVTRSDAEAGWLEEGTGAAVEKRFDLPVTRVTVAAN